MANGYAALSQALNRFSMTKQNSELQKLNMDIVKAQAELQLLGSQYQKSVSTSLSKEEELNTVMDTFNETNVSLETLNQQLGTGGGFNVLDSLNKIESNNYTNFINYENEKTEVLQSRIDAVQSVLTNDIAIAQSIQGGGLSSPILGASSTLYDPEDLTEEGLKTYLGSDSISAVQKEYFDRNPDLTNANMNALNKDIQTRNYYASQNKDKQDLKDKSNSFNYFGTRVKNANIENDFKSLFLRQSYLDPDNEALLLDHLASGDGIPASPDDDKVLNWKYAVVKDVKEFGEELAMMVGDNSQAVSPTTYYRQYEKMVEKAEYITQSKISGAIADPDYEMYHDFLKSTYKNYRLQTTDAGRNKVAALAVKYLGMPEGVPMETFMEVSDKFYSNIVLDPFMIKGTYNTSKENISTELQDVWGEESEVLDADRNTNEILDYLIEDVEGSIKDLEGE